MSLCDIEFTRWHHVNSTCYVVFTRCRLVITTCHHFFTYLFFFFLNLLRFRTTLISFLLDEVKEDPKSTLSGPSSARRRNAINWRAYDGPKSNAGLVAM